MTEFDTAIEGINNLYGIDLKVHISNLPEGLLGFYHYETHQIFVSRDINHQQQRFVLAHELGHALYEHADPCHTASDAQQEHKANEYAIGLLINKGMIERVAYEGMTVQELCHELELPYTDIQKPEIFKLVTDIVQKRIAA